MQTLRARLVGITAALAFLLAVGGCSIIGTPPGGDPTSTTPIPVEVALTLNDGFSSLTLSTPGTQMGGNLQRVFFSDSQNNTFEATAADPETGMFLVSGTTLTFAPRPTVPFPSDGSTGSIEIETTDAGLLLGNRAGSLVTFSGLVFVGYIMVQEGVPNIPAQITNLRFPAKGGAVSDFTITMGGMPGNTPVSLRLGFNTASGADQITVEGTANASGQLTLSGAGASDATVESLTRLVLNFGLPT